MKLLPIAVLGAVLLVVGLLAFGLESKGAGSLDLGDRAPVRELPELGDPDQTRSLADHRGKWVLVNVWASWCDPCREESPALEKFHQQHREDDFTVLGIDTEDLTEDAVAFVREFELTYPQLRDPKGDTRKDWAMTGFPESFLVDPGGKVRPVSYTHLTLPTIYSV